jgi:hypothetical protein
MIERSKIEVGASRRSPTCRSSQAKGLTSAGRAHFTRALDRQVAVCPILNAAAAKRARRLKQLEAIVRRWRRCLTAQRRRFDDLSTRRAVASKLNALFS